MQKLLVKTDPKFDSRLEDYPDKVRKQMYFLKELVREVAEETTEVEALEETLKWGEPSFVTKHGSTLRMDWKKKSPGQYAFYFQCTSRLVDTFRLVFGTKFNYEGNRALVFALDQKLPVAELKACIKATLVYHKVKHSKTLEI